MRVLKSKIADLLKLPFLFLLWVYQNIISPSTPSSCRFSPSCSEYSKLAIKKHGIFKGGILTAVRLLRCNPFGGSGYDDVPEKFEFTKLFKK